MLRKIYTRYMPSILSILIGFVLTLVFTCAAMDNSPSVLDDSGAVPTGPGLNITLGAGLQGNGSDGNPLDVKNGTSNGETVVWNASSNVVDQYCGNPSLRYCFTAEFEQFLTNCTTVYPGFIGTASGAGAGCTGTVEAGHPGILSLNTGTTATGSARMLSNNSVYEFGSNTGISCNRQLVQIPALSTVAQEYLARIGFMDSTTTALSVDAVQAAYDRLTGGDFWALHTCSNSVCTFKACDGTGGTTSAPVVAAQWATLEQCVSADGTSATLSVNGTVCATNTTNIPTGTSRLLGMGAQFIKSAGATGVNFFIDYMRVSLPFSVAR